MFLLFGFLAITKEFNQGRSPPQIRPSSFRVKNNPLLSTIAPKPRYIRLSAIPGKIDRTAVDEPNELDKWPKILRSFVTYEWTTSESPMREASVHQDSSGH